MLQVTFSDAMSWRGMTQKDKGNLVSKATYPKSKNNPLGYYLYKTTLEGLRAHLNGFKWINAGLYKGGVNTANAAAYGSQILAIDFDGLGKDKDGKDKEPHPNNEILSIEGVLELLNDYELMPNIVYKTPSYTDDEPKFRTVFVFDEVMKPEEYAALTNGVLNYAFAEDSAYPADSSCSNISRHFSGGFDATIIESAPYSFNAFLTRLANMCADSSTRKQTQNSIFKEVLNVVPCLYSNNKQGAEFNSSTKTALDNRGATSQYKRYHKRTFNHLQAIKASPVFADFANGDGYILEYKALFGLWLTIAKFRGGHKWFIEAMHRHAENGGEGYKDSTINTLNRSFYAAKYHQTHYERSSKPLNTWFDTSLPDEYMRISDLEEKRTRDILKVGTTEKQTLKKAEQTFRSALLDSITRFDTLEKEVLQKAEGQLSLPIEDTPNTTVEELIRQTISEKRGNTPFIIKAQTGIGKTQNIISLLKGVYMLPVTGENRYQNLILAFPTHKNADEFQDRLKASGFDMTRVVKTPAIPTFEDELLNVRIHGLYRSGARIKAGELIREVGKNKNGNFSPKDAEAARNYTARNKQAMKWPYVTLTTHQRYVNSGEAMEGKLAIIDEDILPALENDSTLNYDKWARWSEKFIEGLQVANKAQQDVLQDIKAIRKHLSEISDNLNKILDTSESINQPPILLSKINTQTLLIEEGFESIIDILQADYVTTQTTAKGGYTIKGINKVSLPTFTDKAMVVLSATANKDLYLAASGGEAVFYDIAPVQNQGRVLLNGKKAWTLNQLTKATEQEIATLQEQVYLTAKALRPNLKKEDLHIITHKSVKNKFSMAHPEMHFGNVAGFDELRGKAVAVIGMATPNPLAMVFRAKAYGINVTSDDIDSSNLLYTTRTVNGFKLYMQGFKNEQLNQLMYQVSTAELMQSNRVRTIREKDALLIYYGRMPTTEVDEIIY